MGGHYLKSILVGSMIAMVWRPVATTSCTRYQEDCNGACVYSSEVYRTRANLHGRQSALTSGKYPKY